mgnify:CR=1 FL=1
MKILVTGGVGFIGTNLIKRLLKEEHEVISFDNYSTGFKNNEQTGCTYYDIDIRKPLDMVQVDVIFHLAALPRIKPSFDNPKEVFDVNVKGTQNVLEYARKTETPVIYAGSSSFWGGVYKNPYTFSKWQGEELCKMYEQIYGLPITICRFYNVYGDCMSTKGEYKLALSIFLEQYKNGESLTITGDGEQRRDFTYVGDIVDGLIRCGENINEIGGEEFELGNGENYSINEVADAFGDYMREYIDERPGEMRETLNTDTKAQDVLGWKPKGDIVKFIEDEIVK